MQRRGATVGEGSQPIGVDTMLGELEQGYPDAKKVHLL